MKGARLSLFAFWCAVAAAAQTGLPENVLQLAQLKRNVRANAEGLVNYTCTETIERWRRPARKPLRHIDTVRVEVAITNDRELYSWPGANRFEDRDVTQIVGSGMTSSGSFASELRSVFMDNVSQIRFIGEEKRLGRRISHWEYSIPYNLSGWRVQAGGHTGRVAVTGSFWADAQSLDLLELQTDAAEIPPDLPITAVHDTIRYARVHIGARDLLLPQTAEIIVTVTGGAQSENRIEFSHCREFASQATLTFDVHEVAGKTPDPVTELSLPAGLRMRIRLANRVDLKSSAVGDSISATVDSAVTDNGEILIPKGALLRGRIRRLERYVTPRDYYIVGLQFTDLEFPGHHAQFAGELYELDSGAGLDAYLGPFRPQSGFTGGTRTRSESEAYWTAPAPGVGTFFVEGVNFRLPAGLHMVWQTVDFPK